MIRKVFIKFSNQTILKYIKTNIFNIKEALDLIRRISSKLDKTVVEQWFNNSIEINHDIFSNYHHITESTKFNQKVFECLLQYPQFKNFIFNCWRNLQFIEEMKDYTNRPDYDYFYQNRGPSRAHRAVKPRDYCEFSFFYDFPQKRIYYKIASYLTRIGYSNSIKLFLNKFLEYVFDDVNSTGYIEQIAREVLLNEEDEAVHEHLWNKLKTHEDLFRSTICYLKNPIEKDLQNILLRNYSCLDIETVSKYINFGFDEEIEGFFNKQSARSVIEIIKNDWNREFLLKVLLRM